MSTGPLDLAGLVTIVFLCVLAEIPDKGLLTGYHDDDGDGAQQ